MSTIKNLAIILLQNTKNHPKMYGSNKEALIMRVSTILEMIEENFNIQNFYNKHLKVLGNSYVDLNEEVNDLWVEQMINDALFLIENK